MPVIFCVVIQIECMVCQNDRGDSWWYALHFVPLCYACLSSSWCYNLCCKSATCYKLLLLVIFMPCLRCDNLVHVYPNEANDMSNCSLWDALHDGCCSIHVRFHIAMLNLVAKVHVVVKLWNMLWDADLKCSLLLMCLSPCHMSICFRIFIIWSLLLCKPFPWYVLRWLKHACKHAMLLLLFYT